MNEKKPFATESTESTEKSILWVRVRLRCFVAAALAAIFGAAGLVLKTMLSVEF